jgi:octaprenyl-diphosphate synthase
MTIEEVWNHYRVDLQRTEENIRATLNTVAPAISMVGEHILMGGGKRIRPLLGIVCSKLFGYNGNKVSILACCIESIHTASLLHDDIIDGAHFRRGRPSANSLWGDQIVVLVGDYLYSNALRLINSLENQTIMDSFSTATAKMSEGELIQLHKTEECKKGDLKISEKDYMNIITGKTAVLMSAACKGGAIIANATQEQVSALSTFGLKLGMTFQIIDDILDYMAEERELGKGIGKDLQEGKITLPLIYLLTDATQKEAERVKAVIKNDNFTKAELDYIIDLLQKYLSIKKSYKKAASLLEEAKGELNIFEGSSEKKALLTISDYVFRRGK